MPTYTYRCPDCGQSFNLFHSISDSSEKLCPTCGTPAQRQMGGGSGISMSGSGSGSSGLSSIPSAPRGGFS
ncbi:zinc ribbon domain-containing protein [bacterium]|nr:zinc ribbon domain-containing protein [bacterium]